MLINWIAALFVLIIGQVNFSTGSTGIKFRTETV